MSAPPPTDKQHEYVRAIQRKLHLPDSILDGHCVRRFTRPYRRLDRDQVSQLLDEMVTWETLPAELARAKGQLDLFEAQP